MLLIFDLDDTLIDTSGCLTPFQLENAIHRMKDAGLCFPDDAEAVEMIKRLNETSETASHALKEFLEINEAPSDPFLAIGLKEIYENISFDHPLFPVDGAIELLEELKIAHHLALVTKGKQEQQMMKMKKAGIDSTIFSKIIVCGNSGDGSKKPHYQTIAEELSVSSNDVLVCGDRIPVDLSPAKQLGYKTVHMRWGRGLHHSVPKEDVDFTIYRLPEIRDILTTLNFSSIKR